MHFTKLVIESFMAIQRADIEFGPGLNILYGPNDLGKSTLARAIRAALLVQPGSSEGAQFNPWYADTTPRVSLTLVDGSAQYWKVSKAFGDAHSGAELLHSKDGTSFTVDLKGRQVEEKVRGLLGWGIPAPGGKTGPRGLPNSFLANALLSAQTDVDAILGESLADDLDASGKLRLTKALATLAQDPVLKKVLDTAQHEVDACFTPQGRRKRGQTSKFTEAGKLVKQLEDERVTLQRQEIESSTIEQGVNALRERRAEAIVGVADGTASLTEVRERTARSRRSEEVRALLEVARKTLGEIIAHAVRVEALTGDLERFASEAGVREESLQRAAAECAAADAALRGAEEAHRSATSEEGARQRELRRAQLVAHTATLSAKKQAAEARRLILEGALKTRATVAGARESAVSARFELEKLMQRVVEARERTVKLEHEAEVARALIAYGRWRAAVSAAEDAGRATTAASDHRASAGTRDSEAVALEARAHTIEEEVSTRAALLPGEQEATALARLERDLAMAEAALGGGISVTVHPRSGIALRVLADQREIIDEPGVSTDRVVEAERRVRLSVEDIVDIEVTAGGAEQRRAADTARTRWNAEVVPVLERARAKSLAEVSVACSELAKERSAAMELRKSAETARADAASLRERAAFHEEQATKLAVNPAELEARSAAIGDTARDVLEPRLAKLGKTWESQAEALLTRWAKELKAAQAEAAMNEQAAKLTDYRASEADRAFAEASAASAAAFAALESPDADGLLRAVVGELASISRGEADVASEMNASGAEASTEVEKALGALEAAAERQHLARKAHAGAAAALDEARAELNARTGERRALAAQLEAMNREGASALVAQREREVEAIPNELTASEVDVEAAERRLERGNRELDAAKEELHKGEGVLSKVGGAAIREELERIDEALAVARTREKDLELDADAWKLLLETLREVENEEGAHLGRALAGPVTTRFAELTSGRYGNLRLDAALKAEAVDVAGGGAQGADVLEALSVGTRNQLATLIRLTIADQLKSAIVLDDHLVNSDPRRLAWFRDVLMKTALNAQIIILTCRPEDYLTRDELPAETATRDLAGGAIRAVDVARVLKRWGAASSRLPMATAVAVGRTDGKLAT
jgi:energy-coupling factor transporter ATP-binding protein EcfA2